MPTLESLARSGGLARAALWSYGPVWRRRRMAAFYARFLGPGDLAFDVGAHLGNRVPAFLRCGARVVAVEPQPALAAAVRRLYRRRGVVVEELAVGAAPGRATLHVSTATPTVSTVSAEWMAQVAAGARWGGVRWDREVEVAVTTLDALIARHGEPAFCKIDVEGAEPDALRGLGRPLAALSFEYLPVVPDRAVACVERLAELGDYRYTYSVGETWQPATPGWVDGGTLVHALTRLDRDAHSGDVYAVRTQA